MKEVGIVDQAVPFHRPTENEEGPPLPGADPRLPQASRSPLAAIESAFVIPTTCPASGAHTVPVQRAMLVTVAPPATTSPFGRVASDWTVVLIPPAMDDQVVPFHRATWGTWMPPAVSNRPPATRSPFPATANASTAGEENVRVRPPPSGDQVVPSQRAMLVTAVPPALSNRPAATRSPFCSTASAFTSGAKPVMPPPNVDQVPVTGSSVAMQGQFWLPTARKVPPITSCRPRGPGPSGSQSNEVATTPPAPAKPSPARNTVAH
ncbi:MAG: hypothetical protein MUC36_29650 [Planctomycetes bacterium]|nr:hypothetical protein [Planctomycetota bacterium]